MLRTHLFRGLTLVELLVVIAILAIIVTVGIPAFQQMLIANRVAAQNNALVALLHFTKSEAIRRNEPIRLRLTVTAGGWNGDVLAPGAAETAPGCGTGVIRCASETGVGLRIADQDGTPTTASAITIGFDNRGYLVDWEEKNLILDAGGRQRDMRITRTGQISAGTSAGG